MPSVLWHCWLGIRKSIQSVKVKWRGVSVWNEMQIVCIWSSWCHCHLKIPPPTFLASFKSRLVLPFWYWLTNAVLEKRQLNRWSSSSNEVSKCEFLQCHNKNTASELLKKPGNRTTLITRDILLTIGIKILQRKKLRRYQWLASAWEAAKSACSLPTFLSSRRTLKQHHIVFQRTLASNNLWVIGKDDQPEFAWTENANTL